MGSDADKYVKATQHNQWMDPLAQPELASIIIPTFNRSTLLNEAIASAAAQTYRPIEVIVVDDGSADGTPAVVNYWRTQLENDRQLTVKYFRQSNSGVGSARNRGLIESKGEFIQFLDSDDILNPEKLRIQIAGLRPYPACGYIFSEWADLQTPHSWPPIPGNGAVEIDSAELYCSLRVHLVMLGLYRRDTCFIAGPFCEDLVSGEDREFNLRVLLSTPSVVYLPGILSAWRTHSDSRITDAFKVAENKWILSLPRLRRMTESAATQGRLNNLRLVRALADELRDVMIHTLEAGRPDLARQAIQISRKMPLGIGRRLRLTIFQILTLLPKSAFQRLWSTWVKFRHAVFENPK
jgi:hypothetical protein